MRNGCVDSSIPLRREIRIIQKFSLVLPAYFSYNVSGKGGKGMIETNNSIRSFQRFQAIIKFLDNLSYLGLEARNAQAREKRLQRLPPFSM